MNFEGNSDEALRYMAKELWPKILSGDGDYEEVVAYGAATNELKSRGYKVKHHISFVKEE